MMMIKALKLIICHISCVVEPLRRRANDRPAPAGCGCRACCGVRAACMAFCCEVCVRSSSFSGSSSSSSSSGVRSSGSSCSSSSASASAAEVRLVLLLRMQGDVSLCFLALVSPSSVRRTSICIPLHGRARFHELGGVLGDKLFQLLQELGSSSGERGTGVEGDDRRGNDGGDASNDVADDTRDEVFSELGGGGGGLGTGADGEHQRADDDDDEDDVHGNGDVLPRELG